jgi:hypothetical protein
MLGVVEGRAADDVARGFRAWAQPSAQHGVPREDALADWPMTARAATRARCCALPIPGSGAEAVAVRVFERYPNALPDVMP